MIDRSEFVKRLLAVDHALAAHGFPAFSPWWLGELRRFLRSDARTWVVRAGRRAGKSTTWAKVAIAWATWGPWSTPPGDVGVVAFVSVSREEASARLKQIVAMLDALGIGYTRRADEVALNDRPCVFRVISATTMAVVGFTSILVIGDEVARWRDSDGTANPAREVIGSLSPTLATQSRFGAFTVLSSSPWTTGDYHAERFSSGDGNGQIASHAATWEANPTITEAETHELEPDLRVHAREYAAEPSASVSAAFDEDSLQRVIAHGVKAPRPRIRDGEHGVTFDVGGVEEGKSATTCLAFHFEEREIDGRISRVLVLDAIRILKPTLLRKVKYDDVVQLIVTTCREYGVKRPRGDRHLHSALGKELQREGLSLPLEPLSMSLPAQARRSRELMDRVRGGTIDVLDHPDAVSQLRGAMLLERGGHFILATVSKRRAPDDVLDTILLACDGEEFGRMATCGGELERVWVGPSWNQKMLGMQGGRWEWRKILANGQRVPVTPPREHADFEAQRSARLARGDSTEQDRLELGRDELRRRLGRG